MRAPRTASPANLSRAARREEQAARRQLSERIRAYAAQHAADWPRYCPDMGCDYCQDRMNLPKLAS